MGKLKELYTIAQETQIDPNNLDEVAEFVNGLNELLYELPRVLQAARKAQHDKAASVERVEAVVHDLEGK